MVNVAVLVSGGGTNLQALLDAEKEGKYRNAHIALVIASKPGVYALERAAKAGVESAVVSRKDFASAEEFNDAMLNTLKEHGIGAVVLSTRFIPQFGLVGGIWRGIFHAISAFCNAGFDLVGGKFGAFTSLEGYNNDPLVLGTIMVLIVSGGLGFFVWEDILRARSWKGFSFYTKMVISVTAGLLIGGMVFFLCVEYNNPATFGSMPLPQKMLNALF